VERSTGLVRDDYFATFRLLPISYDARQPILDALTVRPNVPSGWQGGLPSPITSGSGRPRSPSRQLREARAPAGTVYRHHPRRVETQSAGLVGNHRDAWVYGAVDPERLPRTLGPARAIVNRRQARIEQGDAALRSWDAE